MQYVATIPNLVATLVDVKLTRADAGKTRVDVTYTRTALDPEANDEVRDLASHDAASGPLWARAIHQHLSAGCGAPKRPAAPRR